MSLLKQLLTEHAEHVNDNIKCIVMNMESLRNLGKERLSIYTERSFLGLPILIRSDQEGFLFLKEGENLK